MQKDGTAQGSVASISEWGDDQSWRVTKILVVVLQNTVDDLGPDIVVLPIVSELREPLEVLRVADLFFDKIFLDDVLGVHIKYDKSF